MQVRQDEDATQGLFMRLAIYRQPRLPGAFLGFCMKVPCMSLPEDPVGSLIAFWEEAEARGPVQIPQDFYNRLCTVFGVPSVQFFAARGIGILFSGMDAVLAFAPASFVEDGIMRGRIYPVMPMDRGMHDPFMHRRHIPGGGKIRWYDPRKRAAGAFVH